MTDRRRQILRFLVILAFAQIFAGAQTSLWTHLFGGITPPAFWLMLVAYLALYRDTVEGLINLFFVSFSFSVFTSLPEGLLTLNLLGIFAAARFLKSRFFQATTIYFATTSAFAVFMFYLMHIVLSYFFESTPVTRPEVLATLLQMFFTFIFAVPIFSIMQATDHFLRDEAKDGWGTHRGLGRE